MKYLSLQFSRNVMDDAKLAHFKHFIRQKGVLDTLRTYLDLSDEFLRRMRQADFLTNEQLDTIEVFVCKLFPAVPVKPLVTS